MRWFLCMVWGRGPTSFFSMWLSCFPNTVCWGLSFLNCVFLAPLSKTRWPRVHGCISGFCSIALLSMCEFMLVSCCCHYDSFVMDFEIRKCDASSFILLSQEYTRILLCFPMNFGNFLFLLPMKCWWGLERGWTDSIRPHSNNAKVSNPPTWDVPPFISIFSVTNFFFFCHQCFVVLGVRVSPFQLSLFLNMLFFLLLLKMGLFLYFLFRWFIVGRQKQQILVSWFCILQL